MAFIYVLLMIVALPSLHLRSSSWITAASPVLPSALDIIVILKPANPSSDSGEHAFLPVNIGKASVRPRVYKMHLAAETFFLKG